MMRLTPGRVGVALWVLAGGLQACPLPAYPCSSDGDCDRTVGYACVDGTCVSGVVVGDGGGVAGLDGSAEQPDAAGRDAAMDLDAASAGDAGNVDAAQAGDAALLDGAPAQDAATQDAALADAAIPDAGTGDASLPDAAVLDAGPVDAGVDDAAVVDAAVPDAGPNCWDGLPGPGASWANASFHARSVFRVDVTQFPTGEEVPVRLDVAAGNIPLCGLTGPMLAYSGGLAVPLEVDHVNTQAGTAALWAGVTKAGFITSQDVEIYWGTSMQVPGAPTPFASYVTAQHFTGGAVSTFRGGTLFNNGATTGLGQVGEGLAFSGLQSAGVRNFTPLSNATEITVSTWVRFSAVSLNTFTGILHLRSGNNDDYNNDGVTLQLTDGFPQMEGRDFTWSTQITSPASVTADAWYHLAMTARSGQSVDLYVNGLPVTPVLAGNTLQNGDIAPNTLALGQRFFSGSACCGLAGAVDEARVQTVLRSDAWVLSEFLASNGTLDTFLLSEHAP